VKDGGLPVEDLYDPAALEALLERSDDLHAAI